MEKRKLLRESSDVVLAIGLFRFVIKPNDRSPKFRAKHLLRSAHAHYQLAAKELANNLCDFLRMRLQRKVTGVVEIHLSRRVITPERLRTGGQKEWVILAPDRRAAVAASCLLPTEGRRFVR